MNSLGTIGTILAWVAGIVVLFKLFQVEGVLKGILGLICMLYTFIWGWMKVNDPSLNIKNWMYIWTGAIVLGLILNVLSRSGS